MTAVVNREECVGCGTCVEECPEEAIALDDEEIAVVNNKKCTECGVCVEACPSEAISMNGGVSSAPTSENRITAPTPTIEEHAQYRETKIYDVFLCHNSADKPTVRRIYKSLKEKGIRPWLDEEELLGGDYWPAVINELIKKGKIRSAAVFIGPEGLGPIQDREIIALIKQFFKKKYPVIPVVLPGVEEYDPGILLEGLHYVEWKDNDRSLYKLIESIEGRKYES